MTSILRKILDRITPWHDDTDVDKRIEHAQKEISRSDEITQRTDNIIQQYVLMDTIYHRKRSKTP